MKKILITGSTGFIGSHFLEYILEKTDWKIIATYREKAGLNLKSDSRILWLPLDLRHSLFGQIAFDDGIGKLDYIVHMAAETNVDDSLKNCISFAENNFMGTANLLEWIKELYPKVPTCIFSTDEVMGPAPLGVDYLESDQRRPSNPYAATKGGAELLAYSFAHSFNMPVFVVRCMNVMGARQRETKFIPKVIKALRAGQDITLHGTDKFNVASRHWVHAKDCADAVLFLLDKAEPKEIYHITGVELDVHSIAFLLYLEIIGQLPTEEVSKNFDSRVKFVDYHNARPGHDRRYSLSGEKLKAMGWLPKRSLMDSLKEAVDEKR